MPKGIKDKLGILLVALSFTVISAACGSSGSTPAQESIIRLFYYAPDLSQVTNQVKQDAELDHGMYSAISADGVNFTQEAGVRFERQFVTDPDVFKVATSQYVMFSSEGPRIVKATSDTANGTYVEDTAFNWDMGSVCSTVPIDVKLITFYCSAEGIGYAFYDIDSGFLNDAGTALQNPFGTGVVCDPTVIQLADGTYVMYYKYKPADAVEGPMGDTVYAATSTDGLNYSGNTMIREQASVPGAIRVNGTIYLYYVDGTADSTAVGISTDEGATFEFQNIEVTDAAGANLWDPDPIPYD